ncbi:hypothetical protein [Synoicihabitans lomoniglobus]|uniref:Tetratricopeptide repeat protein n=1 Tax=Synoicihabitans lomoniglobus TaxID=2909285 RepID=A0AAF0CPR5_9BACT|nr:hypothetical protein [Opitutaceae bacterium LMO-M01]WED65795.1 hypothetical protein PXH66_02905 [Opitutaceae bacterium LMO-M01]
MKRISPGLTGSILVALIFLGGCRTADSKASSVERESASVGTAIDAEAQAEVQAARAQAAEANRQLELDRQTLQFAAWQHVKAITEMWRQLPPEYFPGIARLVEQVDDLRTQIEQEDSIMVGQIDPVALTSKNPAFWRAMMETEPHDPVVNLFEQMLWASRGYFDRANWLLGLQDFGPTLPVSVHRLAYGMGDEMRRLRARQMARKDTLLNNATPEERVQVVTAARSFQPGDPDWAFTNILMRLQLAGVNPDRLDESPVLAEQLLRQLEPEWLLVAQHNPLNAARLHPQAEVRAAAHVVDTHFEQLAESRGAYGVRDLSRLAETLADAGLFSEALETSRRATAMRGFSAPDDQQNWWQWLPHLIGADAVAALRTAAGNGEFRPVAFFDVPEDPEGVSLMPLHPIIADRNLRRLQEIERRLLRAGDNEAERTGALIARAETLGHLGRWDQAEAALDDIPENLADAAAPMHVWLALWSGRLEGLDAKVAALDPAMIANAPALPALAEAALGRWGDGVDLFLRAVDSEANDNEYRTYYTLMASAFARLAGEEKRADELLDQARGLGESLAWVSVLVNGMAGESTPMPVGENITEITEAGRICEQRFYRAFQRDISPLRQRSLLEGCVATGVVDFVEYTASLLRLRQLDPERWDPTKVPPPPPPSEAAEDEDDDWTRGASPSWSIPS